MPYIPLTGPEKRGLLREIGVSSLDDLIRAIPSALRGPEMSLPEGMSEPEVQRLVRDLGALNTSGLDFLSFLGAGSYDHFIPSAVQEVISRQEFSTAYTPYQPEASQGTLQAIFEYQSLMAERRALRRRTLSL